jgi:hypothetical protein
MHCRHPYCLFFVSRSPLESISCFVFRTTYCLVGLSLVHAQQHLEAWRAWMTNLSIHLYQWSCSGSLQLWHCTSRETVDNPSSQGARQAPTGAFPLYLHRTLNMNANPDEHDKERRHNKMLTRRHRRWASRNIKRRECRCSCSYR